MEGDLLPDLSSLHRGVEFKLDGVFALALELQHVVVLIHANLPLGVRADVG